MVDARRRGDAVPRRSVDGVFLLDKPIGLSSNAALQRVKRAFNARKAGHTGTLDPLASGLLPICLGEATKFSQGLTDATKAYRTEIRLGVTTETGDVEGRVTQTRPVNSSASDIEAALQPLRGEIWQTPHRYSALKRDGRALYDYARAGESVDIAPRRVRIDELIIESIALPILTAFVRCSKGTYVRSLAESIGAALGCGAHVAALRRVEVGRFDIADAMTLEHLESTSGALADERLLPPTVLVAELERAVLSSHAAERFSHGLAVPLEVGLVPETMVAVYTGSADDAEGRFLGLGRTGLEAEQLVVRPARLLAGPPTCAG